MLADFQQAFADLVASPDLCIAVRQEPGRLRDRYALSALEWRRLVAMVSHPNMACNCMLYRANRIAPLVMHLPRLCKALGPALRAQTTAYWAACPEPNVLGFVEAERFAGFVADRLPPGVPVDALQAERAALAALIAASRDA